LFSVAPPAQALAPHGPTVTKMRENGLSSNTFLFDAATNTNGFLNVARDEVANITTIEFSYATPDTVDPEIVILVQGIGEMPNSAFTISPTTAHLAGTTPFPNHRCVVNIVTAYFDCADGEPITFDLSWVKNGMEIIQEKVQRTQTIGPLTIKFKGEFESVTATVNGAWTGHLAADMIGNLIDNKSNTNIREVTMAAHP
jgi:hypothetical protein